MTRLWFDPDLKGRFEEMGVDGTFPTVRNALESRKLLQGNVDPPKGFSVPESIQMTVHNISSYDGAEIQIYQFTPKHVLGLSAPQPALLHFHGGGLCTGMVDPYAGPGAAQAALDLDMSIFAVEYRLVPEHPYPAPVEDCYASLKWLSEHATDINVDAARIGVWGVSAGGLLAAAVVLLARDRKLEPPVAKQFLIYPMLDDRCSPRCDADKNSPERAQYLTGIRSMNDCSWDAYLNPKKRGDPDISIYASPARATDLTNLPPAYIDVGCLDLLRDESLAYATKLCSAGVDVEFHLYSGATHGFDLRAPDIPIALNAKENRNRSVRNMIARDTS
ncbi:hypothetical protein NQ176_g1966 [Zarea fungicola]|uniref:Uncharacterized protein n=1 Tax=Zarea fungicola TaxID=93591 RepID=A0ACC1NRI6_9HYPO|nr:hypothetical protein NQ176_g1966 [Lecanicillium fungicola]